MTKKIQILALIFTLFAVLCGCNEKLPPYEMPVATEPSETNEKMRSVILELQSALDTAPVVLSENVDLRKFPYPYNAMLCITSDCDSTRLPMFEQVHKYLNTFEQTDYGAGLGLDIADSFFAFNGSDSSDAWGIMSYFQGVDTWTPRNTKTIKKYYDCGWIDSIHALGDFSYSAGTQFSRALAEAAWKALDEEGIKPTVWIDHGNESNVQNFGAYSMFNSSKYQKGDDPRSPYYHTDLTLAAGVRYAWFSRHSDTFGQDYPLTVRKLRDGQSIWSFTRYTCEIDDDIQWNWRFSLVDEQLYVSRLDELEQKGQYAIVAQHLTMFQEHYTPGDDDLAALRLLASRHHEGRILVARTSRLLDYAVATRYTALQTASAGGYTAIRLLGIEDPVTGRRLPQGGEFSGLTFYVENPEKTLIFIGSHLLSGDEIQQNPPDDTGRASIAIRWFEPDTTDYTAIPLE